jgi:hypothetical protein
MGCNCRRGRDSSVPTPPASRQAVYSRIVGAAPPVGPSANPPPPPERPSPAHSRVERGVRGAATIPPTGRR